MTFTRIEFFIFFAAVVGFLYVIKNNKQRKLFLLAASYYFYAYWDYRFLSLLIISTLVDYIAGIGLNRYTNERVRKLLLFICVLTNLGILFFFKYFNFFVSSLNTALSPLNVNLGTLNIILPIGISFYTFQAMSYSIDIYRRKMEPVNNLLDFALYVAFFPQLVAGPIVRASDFLPQLKSKTKISRENFVIGFRIFVIGLLKKVFIADKLALFVDPVFANYSVYDTATIWLAILAYSIQIYCDFAGYSDMAIGAARIMGYELNINFNFPYLAKNMQDFWRRWHISLSSWIRDYVYIPLGGNRLGKRRTIINTIVTMFLCGLWHGAAWTFAVWGLFHGIALAVGRIVHSEKSDIKNSNKINFQLKSSLERLFTLFAMIVGWVLFRSQTFTQASSIIFKMLAPTGGVTWIQPFVLFIIAGTVLYHLIVYWDIKLLDFIRLPEEAWYTPAALFSMVWLIIVFHPMEFKPFIYFQF